MAKRHLTRKDLVVVVGLVCVIAWVLAPRGYPQRSMRTQCVNNLNRIGIAMELYCADWGDRRPPLYTTDQYAPQGKAWPDLLMPYLKKLRKPGQTWTPEDQFRCPVPDNHRMTYSLNPTPAGLPLAKIKYPSTTISVFDTVNASPGNNNLNGGAMSRPTKKNLPPTGSLVLWPDGGKWYYRGWPEWARLRHRGSTNVLHVDGHVSSVTHREEFTDQYSPHFELRPPLRQ